MAIGEIVAIIAIVAASVVLALVAGAETALERTNVARIQSLARQGNAAALRIVGTVERPLEPLGPLTTARVLAAAGVVSAFAYIGAEELGAGGAAWIGIGGGAYAALVQMTVGTLAARRPEYSVLQLHRVIVAARYVFAAPAWVLSVPARVIAAPLQGVGPGSQNEDILALLEREEASGGVEEEEERMIRGIIGLEDKTAREVMVPRIDIVATEVEVSVREAARLATERGFSRYSRLWREHRRHRGHRLREGLAGRAPLGTGLLAAGAAAGGSVHPGDEARRPAG